MLLGAVVSPVTIYAGLAAAGVPVLIHLLSRRRFRRIRWAAMDFLLDAERQNRRRIRIEQLILLTLRCLAMLLIGLLLARVYVRPSGLAGLLGRVGASARTDRIILLDDTYSMGYRDETGTCFDRATTAIVQLARWIQQEGPQDTFTVVTASDPDRFILRAAAVREMNLSELKSRLESLRPSDKADGIEKAIVAVRTMLDARPETVATAVYIVSDFQARDWAQAAGGASGRGPLAPLAGWTTRDRALRVVLFDVGSPEPTRNLSLVSLEPDQPLAVAGVPARFTARLIYRGPGEARPDPLRIYVGEASQPPVTVPPIRSGQTVGVPIELTFASPGPVAVTAELPDDRLPTDNRRYATVEVLPAVRVLVINGEPGADAFDDEVGLLTAALRPEGPVFSGIEVEATDEGGLEEMDLQPYPVVMLANVYRAGEAATARLRRYTEDGGSVVFFLGDQVDAAMYNRFLWDGGAGILPGPLGRIVEAPPSRDGFRFVEPDYGHALLRNFAGLDVPVFEGIFTRQFVAIGTDQTAAQGGDQEGTSTRPTARVLLRFDDPERHPAILERIVGRGRVVLIATTADKEWTNWPDSFAYVAMMQELVQAVARPTAPGGDVLVGSPLRVSLPAGRYLPEVLVRTPAFPETPQRTIEARPDIDGKLVATWPSSDRAGVYRFGLRETGGATGVRLAAVNVDPAEGDLTKLDEDRLRAAIEDVPFVYVRSGEANGPSDQEARRELWPAALVALVAVLMAESGLAYWFGRRS